VRWPIKRQELRAALVLIGRNHTVHSADRLGPHAAQPGLAQLTPSSLNYRIRIVSALQLADRQARTKTVAEASSGRANSRMSRLRIMLRQAANGEAQDATFVRHARFCQPVGQTISRAARSCSSAWAAATSGGRRAAPTVRWVQIEIARRGSVHSAAPAGKKLQLSVRPNRPKQCPFGTCPYPLSQRQLNRCYARPSTVDAHCVFRQALAWREKYRAWARPRCDKALQANS
jgi:hypothetical protein